MYKDGHATKKTKQNIISSCNFFYFKRKSKSIQKTQFTKNWKVKNKQILKIK